MSADHDTLLLDHASGILVLVDQSSLAIAAASKSTLRLLGYRREEFVGRPITDVECSLADVFYWEELSQGGPVETQGVEASYRCANGNILLATKTVSRAADGQRRWLVIRAEPLDLQRRTQDELALVTSRLQATLEATAEGILLLDRTGRIINMNRRFSQIWGLPDALLLEHEDSLIFGFMAALFADPIAYQANLAAISPTTDEQSFDVLHLADGRIFERTSMPARNAEQIFGRVYSFADITERKRTEAACDQLQAQLRESQKMEALGTLAGGVAHDFNNIVATIAGNVELACQDVGPAHAALVSLDEIRRASQRAKVLVRQILAFGKRQTSERELISLEQVVTDSLRILRTMIPTGVNLVVDCATGVPTVQADANQIQQVLLNLCGNAWHAVQGLDHPGTIEVRLEHRIVNQASDAEKEWQPCGADTKLGPGRYACLIVRDNGRGMDATTRERMFEPFFTTKPVGEGTGLGLSVVHGIVRDHEATIGVRSKAGEGTTFCIFFRTVQASDCACTAPEAGRRRPVTAARDGDAPMPREPGGHILYVDDDESIVFLMTRLMQRKGYRVSGYTDPREAVAAMRADRDQFDLAITDYNMPELSGLDVVRALREIRADLPVAIASGYITDELRAKAPAAGVSELIYKPNTVDELCEVVARLAGSLRGAPKT